MTRSKKVFIAVAVVFFAALFYASYDISTRTTFPGSRPQLKERLKKQYAPSDSTLTDSVNTVK